MTYNCGPHKVPHKVDSVLTRSGRAERLLQIGFHGIMLSELCEQSTQWVGVALPLSRSIAWNWLLHEVVGELLASLVGRCCVGIHCGAKLGVKLEE